MQVLFASTGFGGVAEWPELQPLLPDWQIATSTRDRMAAAAVEVDVLVPLGTPVDAMLIRDSRFGLIQQFGVGVENIDLDAATAAGVWVCRLPSELTGNAESVAEIAVLGTLTALRRYDEARRVVRTGIGWSQPAGRSLIECTVAVIGLGAIGTAVVDRLAGFGPRIVAARADPSKPGPAAVTRVVGPDQLASVLAEADVVICAAMAGADTEHLFDAGAFAAMRPGTVFVNVSRGNVVDEPALLAALESGQVAAAALDVHAREPADPDSALLRHPAVIATPHVGGVTTTMFTASARLLAENLDRWRAGAEPRFAVNHPPFQR